MTEPAFVALGSNLGDRRRHLEAAADELHRLASTRVIASSAVEETDPIGPSGQGPYLNQMLLLRTDLEPRALLQASQTIEAAHGRTRDVRWGARTLDIDIVAFDDRRVAEPDLRLPHPELRNRPFWLRELAELLPQSWDAEAMGYPPWATVKPGRLAHIQRVAGLIAAWAMAMEVPERERRRWIRAALLHDAARDLPSDEQTRLAGAEWSVPALRHGPAAAALAAEHGERDGGVLDAVRYHTVGYAGWDEVGRMLYLADYLEPGRTFQGDDRARLAAAVPIDPAGCLKEVARRRRTWLLESGLAVPTVTAAFWKHVGVDA